MPFQVEEKTPFQIGGEVKPLGFSETASPDNWPDLLPPNERATLDTLGLDDNQKNDAYDTAFFADIFRTDPNDIDPFLPEFRKEFDFQPHKDNMPFDGRKRLSEAVKHGYRRGGIMMVKQLAGLAQQEVELGGRFRDWFWKKSILFNWSGGSPTRKLAPCVNRGTNTNL